MKKFYIVALSLCLAILLAACGGEDKEKADTEESGGVEITDAEKVDEDEVVAVVNGDEVKGDVYNLVYTQLKLYATQLGDDLELEEIKEATITSVVDRQIVLQEADKIDIGVSEKEADEYIDKLRKESKEELETLLGQYQITEEEFREQIIFELTMNEYMKETVEVTVTDEELEEYYEKAKEGNDAIPPFEEAKAQLKKQVLAEKTNEAFQENIDEVKEKSDIDIKL